MSSAQSNPQYDMGQPYKLANLQSICAKQHKLIELLQKQLLSLKTVIVSMEREVRMFEDTVRALSLQYQLEYKGVNDLSNLLPSLISRIDQIVKEKSQLIQPSIQFRQIIKQVPILVQKQVQIIKQVEKPIFIEKIREIQKPVFVQKIKQVQKPIYVQKIVQLPCQKCQIASHKRIKT